MLLLIPSALARTYGQMVGDKRQGYAVLAAATVLWAGSVVATTAVEVAHPGTVPQAVGAAMEGKEVRFDTWASALFAASTTGTSTGAVNAMHDTFTAAGGGVVLFNMMLGEVSPGGVGAGLYGTFYNTALGLAMLVGRFLPIVFVLALAGSLARPRRTPVTAGTLPTHKPLFVTLYVATIVIVAGLTFFPALALGPIAEALI
jgi:K+-transporting ATPase A subunit